MMHVLKIDFYFYKKIKNIRCIYNGCLKIDYN